MRWKRVIYCSHSTVSMENPLNLAEILGASARNNRRDEITGVLAHADGLFIQAVEGPPHAVDALMVRLRSDIRHRDLRVIGEDISSERAFPVWVMETPRMRPDRTASLRELVKSCEGSFGSALRVMLELSQEQEDQRRTARTRHSGGRSRSKKLRAATSTKRALFDLMSNASSAE